MVESSSSEKWGVWAHHTSQAAQSLSSSQLKVPQLMGLGSWLLPGFDRADRQGLLPLHVRAKALPSLEECN